MNAKFRYIIVLIFIIKSSFAYTQIPKKENQLNIDLKKTALTFKSETNFFKAYSYFLAKNWDSTLVYSMQQLITNSKNLLLSDYAHYFRAKSFYSKHVFKQAAIEFNKISPSFKFKIRVKLEMANTYSNLLEFKKALVYYNEVEKHINDYEKLGLDPFNFYHNKGTCYLLLSDYKLAEKYFMKALSIDKQNDNTIGRQNLYTSIANLNYQQYRDDTALVYFKKAYDISKNINDFEVKRLGAYNMANFEENRGRYKQAIVYRKELEKWKDSLNNQNKVWEVAEIEKKFAVQQKQKQVNVLVTENKLKVAERNKFIYSSIALVLLLSAGIYFYTQKVKSNKIILSQKLELDQLNASKDKLFSIVSHDLRSSVNALKNSNKKILENLESKKIDELDGLLRNNSAITNGAYNLLDNLLNWALLQTQQTYFNQESLRLFFIVEHVAFNYTPLMAEKNIEFENKVSKKDFVFADQESLKIILRNFLDNAIKFTPINGKISVYTRETTHDYCELVIEDNGIGMSNDLIKEFIKENALLSKKQNEEIIGTGLGLQLCKSMIKKNNGKFGIESKLNEGTKMIISLPKSNSNG